MNILCMGKEWIFKTLLLSGKLNKKPVKPTDPEKVNNAYSIHAHAKARFSFECTLACVKVHKLGQNQQLSMN